MSDRNLIEPGRAGQAVLQRLATQVVQMRNRQRWPGAIQRTVVDGGGSSITDSSVIVVSTLRVLPGSWAVIGRVGWQLASTPGSPIFTGSEQFTASLRVTDVSQSTVIEVLDSDTIAPACTEAAFTGGFYADSALLIGSGTWEEEVILQVTGSSNEPNVADHSVTWRVGKIIATPF